MQDTIKIDGREFHGVDQELSAAQDDYLAGQLRLAGVYELLAVPALKEPKRALSDAEAQELSEAMLTRILVSGLASKVLAGCLTEKDKKWTVDDANRNAEIFAAVTDPDIKRAMRTGLVQFVLGFFRFATASVATSRRSSIRKSKGRVT